MTQLSLFDPPVQPKSNYWKEMHGFDPKPGDIARVDEVVSYCETLGSRAYCFCMRVRIIEINGDTAKVKTTKEWETSCGGFIEYSGNNAGNVWIVDKNQLAPIL